MEGKALPEPGCIVRCVVQQWGKRRMGEGGGEEVMVKVNVTCDGHMSGGSNFSPCGGCGLLIQGIVSIFWH